MWSAQVHQHCSKWVVFETIRANLIIGDVRCTRSTVPPLFCLPLLLPPFFCSHFFAIFLPLSLSSPPPPPIPTRILPACHHCLQLILLARAGMRRGAPPPEGFSWRKWRPCSRCSPATFSGSQSCRTAPTARSPPAEALGKRCPTPHCSPSEQDKPQLLEVRQRPGRNGGGGGRLGERRKKAAVELEKVATEVAVWEWGKGGGDDCNTHTPSLPPCATGLLAWPKDWAWRPCSVLQTQDTAPATVRVCIQMQENQNPKKCPFLFVLLRSI